MALQEVKSKVLEDAREKAEKLEKEADEQREEIIEEAEDEAEKIEKTYSEKLEEDKKAYEKKSVSNANMKAKQEKLKAKQEMLEKVFENFRQRLSNLSIGDKEDYLNKSVEKADFEPGKVVGSSEFEDIVDEEFEKTEKEGVILVSKDGEKRQDFTFDKILERFKQEHRQQVAEKIFK